MTPVESTLINGRWELLLPPHRAARLEWPTWERERLAAMHECISVAPLQEFVGDRFSPLPEIPRHVVYDIGAEEGDFPALWASWGADVVLVEPNPLVWSNIRTVFHENGLEGRVRGWFVGFAGEHARDREWHLQPGQSVPVDAPHLDPWGHDWPICAYGPVIGDHGFLVLPERPDVPVTTVDLLAARHGPPTVITIDVEGAELTVLRGATTVLQHHRPAVFVSVHLDLPWIDEKYPGDTGDKVREFMESHGYNGRWLATDHEEHWEWRHPEGR